MNKIKNLITSLKHELGVNRLDDLSYESQIEVARVYFQDDPNKVVILSKIEELLDNMKNNKGVKDKKYFKEIFINKILGKDVEHKINSMFEEA